MDNYREELGVFFRESDMGPASVIVNLTVGKLAPVSHLPTLLRVVVAWPTSPTVEDTGLRDFQDALEMELIGAISRETGAVFVARELTSGQMKFYFYVPLGTSADPIVVQVLKKFPGFRHRLSCISDPDWTIYFDDLYPTRVEFQLMENHELQLSAGEVVGKLEVSRPVCHWIYFEDPTNREEFLSRIESRGFRFKLLEHGEQFRSTQPYGVELFRNDRADHPFLDELVLSLCRQADDCGGEYDGFEAETLGDRSLDLSATLK